MFKLNRKLEYALISLKHLHAKRAGELATAKEISTIYKTPFDATSRVLQIMASRGLLKSEHGAHGGYCVSSDLATVSFFDLAEFILGPIAMVDCLYEDECGCELHHNCNIVSPLAWLNEKTREFYKGLSIQDLLSTHPRHGATAGTEAIAGQFVV